MEYPRCKTCNWLDGFGECTNTRIAENSSVYHKDGNYLDYSYLEGGAMKPGPEFGCINHSSLTLT